MIYLKNAVLDFECSEQTVDDYLAFIVVCSRVLQQSGGLLWSDIKRGLEEVLTDTEE